METVVDAVRSRRTDEGSSVVTRGLVIGKFLPPHRGHKYLIETALAHVDQLDILVCSRADQPISGELRSAWMAELHPTAHIRLIDDPGEDDNSRFWAGYTVQLLGYAPDIVFSSEDYGEAYARCMGCRHVMVDRARVHVPTSGSAIRRSPLRHWDFIEPCVKAYFAKRVCIVGAESTGTTTLARELAKHYQTVWVPEYAREYCEKVQASGADLWTYPWRSEEFTDIATRQQHMEDFLARQANRVLICDTDAMSTGIWHERYMKHRSAAVEAVASGGRHDLYVLTDCDIPFVQDGLRDGESIRKWMTERFEEVLRERGCSWIKVSGSLTERLRAATLEIEKLLA